MAQERIEKPASQKRTEAPTEETPKDLAPVGEEIRKGADAATEEIDKALEENKGETDGLIEEIDAVLEQNAEEFVKNYVQRGGE